MAGGAGTGAIAGSSANGGNSGNGTASGGAAPGGAGGAASAGISGAGVGAVGGTSTGDAGSAGFGAVGVGGAMPPSGGLNSEAGPWGTPVVGGPAPSGVPMTATVKVDSGHVIGHVGPGFAGFSVEKTHLTNSTLTSKNGPLIALYKLLGPTVLRIGANDADNCTWTPSQKPGSGGPPFGLNIGSAMVDDLRDFADATSARVIYAVNFKANNISNSADEAAYAQMKLGQHLYGFEIGNELDKYATWAAQQTQWEMFAAALGKSASGAALVGPACTTGAYSSFTLPFANAEASKIALLTQHYYTAGAGSTGATVASLQTPKANIVTMASALNDAAVKGGIRDGFRFDECNSFSGHGQMGISDTLIAGLWAIDFMLLGAENGSSGVNFHGGETGMDGGKPFYYDPIVETDGAVTAVMPVYYGMLFTYLAGQGPVLATSVSTQNPNFTAYTLAYQADHSTSVVLNNKHATQGVQVTVDLGAPASKASAIYLQGKNTGSLTAALVTLAGAAVTAAGEWQRNAPYVQSTSGTTVSVFVPPASAALVRVE